MSGLPEGERPLYDRDGPDASLPLLVSGLAATGVLAADGEFHWLREARGGLLEWAGVYGGGARLTSAWRVGWVEPGGAHPLSEAVVRVTAYRSHVESVHRFPGLELTQLVCPAPHAPALTRQFRLQATGGTSVSGRLTTEFVPFLMPVLLEGVKLYDYRVQANGSALRVDTHGFGLEFESDPKPEAIRLNGRPWNGAPVAEELRTVSSEIPLTVTPAEPITVRYVVQGGLERELPRLGSRISLVPDSVRWPDESRRRWTAWRAQIPRLELPDAPEIEEAYRLAAGALHSLYFAPQPEMTGLVAGYPWYRALWFRDQGWMLPAVLWLGDAPWVGRALRTIFRFQAQAHFPLLAAQPGELPMQLSPGPIFLYGTSDTTLYYPGVVLQYLQHSGDLPLAHELLPGLRRIAVWAAEKVDARSGLLRNGGEIAGLRDESSVLGKVHYGFDAPDTTIWDSTDRRDHAIDVQVLWVRALEALAELEQSVGGAAEAEPLQRMARDLRSRIAGVYRWPEEGYLYDSLAATGAPVRKVRPNALRAVSAGLFTGDYARALVQRAHAEDLSTPWGVRTLSNRDPTYSPIAYHDGQVWTIATAWAADAAFAVGENDLGVHYLAQNAERLTREFGQANECYRGDRDEPYDSCFLLGFSVAPFLTTLFERLFGLAPDMTHRLVRVSPRLPTSWARAAVRGISLGDGRLDLEVTAEQVSARWTGSEPLILVGDGASVEVLPNSTATLALRPT